MNFPPVPSNLPGNVAQFLRSLINVLQRDMAGMVHKNEAVGSVLLVSPNRSVYSVQVADDGTLSTTKVSG